MVSARAHPRRLLGIRQSSLLLSVYSVCYVGYLLSGALVFTALEAPPELAIRDRLLKVLHEFKTTHPCVSEKALESLVEEVVGASNRGVSAANNVTGQSNWIVWQSLFFSSTVVTTIGYGNVTPLSREGKVFCMVYATIGIPLTLVFISALVDRLMVHSSALLHFFNSRLSSLSIKVLNIRILHLVVVGGIVLALGIFLPAAFFALLEPQWDYLDSFYYCFITLTTIGLGDYIPGESHEQPYHPLYKLAATVYLFGGLTLIMLLLRVYYEIPELNLGVHFLMGTDVKTTDPEKIRLPISQSHEYEEKTSSASVNPGGITAIENEI